MTRNLNHAACNRAHPQQRKLQATRNDALLRASVALRACQMELEAAVKRIAELEAQVAAYERCENQKRYQLGKPGNRYGIEITTDEELTDEQRTEGNAGRP